jgi:hypothetical protein
MCVVVNELAPLNVYPSPKSHFAKLLDTPCGNRSSIAGISPPAVMIGDNVNFDIRVNPACVVTDGCPAAPIGVVPDVLTVTVKGTGKVLGQLRLVVEVLINILL